MQKLVEYPEIQKRLRDEILEHIGSFCFSFADERLHAAVQAASLRSRVLKLFDEDKD